MVVGLASGLVGAGYVEALKYLTRVLGPGGFARPTHLVLIVAVGATIALAAAGEWMRRARWFPSIGGKLLIGTVVGLLLVFTA